MKTKLSLLAAISCMLISCEREMNINEPQAQTSSFTGSIEQMVPDTKVYLDENRNIRWAEGDEVIIFNGTTLGMKYRVNSSSVGETSASFEYIGQISSGFVAGTELSNNVAYYPLDPNIRIARADNNDATSSYMLTDVVLPSEQTYAENSFGPGSNAMVAVTSSVEDGNLKFKNICGGIKLNIKGSGRLSRIILTGNNKEVLSGNANVTAYVDGDAPTVTIDNGGNTLILNMGEKGVLLDPNKSKAFFIAVPPTVFTKGFNITLSDNNGGGKTISTSSNCEVKRSIILKMPEIEYHASVIVSDGGNLAFNGSANSYIVPSAGTYKFPAVKGNSTESVGEVVFAQVLWESFGTDTAPAVGDLIKSVSLLNGNIVFQTADTYKEGNALIAAKDASGKILWSWHIWLTDYPLEQEYYNNAGIMMDRNLGATSATPGDVESNGLWYQWGRKDPFMGMLSIDARAKSTGTWPEIVVSSDASVGTVAYAQENPTTYISGTSSTSTDWHYSRRDNTLWQSIKTIYDPCPPGWRVPDGGSNGVWSKASGSTGITVNSGNNIYDNTRFGLNFSGIFGDSSIIWYPPTSYGKIISSSGQISNFYLTGYYGSVSTRDDRAYRLYFELDNGGGWISKASTGERSLAMSVRCCKE